MRSKLCAIAILSLGSSALSAEPATRPTIASAGETNGELGRASFRAGVLEGCMSKAPKGIEAGFDISPTCTCAADMLAANITDAELTQLEASQPETLDRKIQATMAACLRSTPPVRAR